MKLRLKLLLFSLFICFCADLWAQLPSLNWANDFPGLGQLNTRDICVDSNGDNYMIGTFGGTVDFDPGPGLNPLTSGTNGSVFIAKSDVNGNFIWALDINSSNAVEVYSIATDSANNILVVGLFKGTVDFDSGIGVYNVSASGTGYHSYILKLDQNGVFQWVKTFGDSSYNSTVAVTVSTTQANEVIVTGTFSSTIDFDPGPGVNNFTATGFDLYMIKLSPLGNLIWVNTYDAFNVMSPLLHGDIKTDNLDNIYLVSHYSDSVDFGTTTLYSAGGEDICIVKFDASGTVDWAKSIGNAANNYGRSITIDNSGNVIISADFSGSMDFDPGAGSDIKNAVTSRDAFLLKLDTSGEYVWSALFSGTNNSWGMDVDSDIDNNIYLTGGFESNIDLDPGPGINTIINNGSGSDGYVLKVDSNAVLKWGYGFGSLNFEMSKAIDWDNGVVYVSGYIQDSADVDPGPASVYINSGASFYAGYLIQLDDCAANYVADSVNTCQSGYTWLDGITYTNDTIGPTWMLTNSEGCDSLVTLYLTMKAPSVFTDVVIACDSYLWIDGNTYSSSNNTATHILTNAAGCDSVVTLDLVVNYSNTGTDVQTACDSYLWIDGNTYSSSNNTATHILTNAAGCDSVVTLDLVINYSNTAMDVQTACDSYLWIDGNTYNSSNNTATHILTNAAGCDSIITLDLVVNYSNTGTDVQTACDSYLWIDGNTYSSSNNTATHILTNAAGCDSIVTLDLVVNYSNTGTDVQTACDSYLWIDGNTYSSNNNTATHILTNAAGCDSVVTLDLTVNSVDVSTTMSGLTITANTSGADYQWLDCNNFSSIVGETNQSYTAGTNGDYAVVVTQNGCSDTSACRTINEVGIDIFNINTGIDVYPNPTTESIIIKLDGVKDATISIMSLGGKEVYSKQSVNQAQLEVSLAKFSNGVYFVHVAAEERRKTIKVIKH